MEMNQDIEINIDELVLHGFSPADRSRIGNAVEHELRLIFTQQGIPSSLMKNSSLPFLDGGTFQAKPNASAASTGQEIAGSVYNGLASDKLL